MPTTKSQNYIDSKYKELNQTKRGKKMIDLCVFLAEATLNKKGIAAKMGVSNSEVRELLKILIKEEYVVDFHRDGSIHKNVGRPKIENKNSQDLVKIKKSENTQNKDVEYDEGDGRPPHYYSLTSNGRFLIKARP